MSKNINNSKVLKKNTTSLAVLSAVSAIFISLIFLEVGINAYSLIPAVFVLLLGLKANRRIKKQGGILANIAALIGSTISFFWIVIILMFNVLPALFDAIELTSMKMAYDGDSTKLERTIIVPTLNTPIPKDKNVIWCSSFQIAWNNLKNNVIGEPIKIIGAKELCDRLNTAEQSSADINMESYYTASGFVKDGIIEKIKKEMPERFPDENIPMFPAMDPEAIVAFAFLEGNVPFKIPFFENPNKFVFQDSQGNEAEVTSFGIRLEDRDTNRKVREQVEILYCDPNNPIRPGVFAIDPCKYTKPYQIVLARISPKETLGDTVTDLENKIAEYQKQKAYSKFGISDILLIPNMFWRIEHCFEEFSDKSLGNDGFEGYPIGAAIQLIEFRLDRSGAKLKSTAFMIALCGPRRYIFDEPFLLYIKKRGARYPFFAMWIDNAELLIKSE